VRAGQAALDLPQSVTECPSRRKTMIAYSFFQHNYVVTRRQKKRIRRHPKGCYGLGAWTLSGAFYGPSAAAIRATDRACGIISWMRRKFVIWNNLKCEYGNQLGASCL
jgi:hypothetical protein